MKAIRRLDQYLRLRGDTWHYVRRVPKAVRHIDNRTLIYRSLDTDSRKVARQRRDICADEDNQRWNEIMPNRFPSTPKDANYRDASHRARSKGFNYQPMENLVSQNTVTDLLHRLIALEPLKDSPQKKEERDADALLGSVKTPSVTITEAMDLYLSEIVADELSSKSPEQITNFSKIKRRAVANFVNLNGDIDMRDITREHAHAVRKFWHERIHPKDGSKPMSGSSGNKDLGSLRKLYRRYFEHIGEEERENPFRNMRFKDKILTKVMPFKDDWVRSHILAPDVFEGLNRQGALLCMALIETGCRPSELANIRPENIRLNAEVPHIRIRPTKDRELKSGASVRDIPLVGVALEAMRQAPNGFPHYRDRSYLLSASLTKAFKARGLLPSKQHRIYSFRHSFESRMLEAGLDFGLRCTLMGHRNPRPEYGDGGSLAYRRDELLKIAHPVSDELLQSYPFRD
jgi:integrase